MKIPRPISSLIESFERLPGIGPKTAQRLTFYLLHVPQEELERFANSLVDLRKKTQLCDTCKNVGDGPVCAVCSDANRDKNTILVVASPLDVLAIEKTNFKGAYHVLHGLIDPLNNIGPEEIYISALLKRLNTSDVGVVEVILATNTTMEGESTAMYISKLIRESGFTPEQVKITRIARGLPVGGDIEYADDITLSRALDGRLVF